MMGNAVSRPLQDAACAPLPVFLALFLALYLHSAAQAKKPGERHCYGKVCVHVLTIEEVKQLLGKTVKQITSYYDDPSVDPFNRGTFTSNGERFSADDPTRTASANFPDGTELLLRNPQNGRVSHVRVNDFGPFWGDRDLDVTYKVAEDLDFIGKGVVELEATIVALPSENDIRPLYSRDRDPIPTLGHLGVRTPEETIQLARILLQRLSGEQQKIIFAKEPIRLKSAPTIVKREKVFHYVPKQPQSPRAAGAETYTHEVEVRAQQALKVWRAGLAVRRENQFFVFSWISALLIIVLTGPIVGTVFALMIYIGAHSYILAFLGWNPYGHGELPQGLPQSEAKRDLPAYQREGPLMRREMMSRHTITFDESYAWPQFLQSYGSARPPGDRAGLTFDVGYIWPGVSARFDDDAKDVNAPATSGNGKPDLKRENSGDDAKEMPDETIDLAGIDVNDEHTNLPAHERLRRRLDNMRPTFSSSKRHYH